MWTSCTGVRVFEKTFHTVLVILPLLVLLISRALPKAGFLVGGLKTLMRGHGVGLTTPSSQYVP